MVNSKFGCFFGPSTQQVSGWFVVEHHLPFAEMCVFSFFTAVGVFLGNL